MVCLVGGKPFAEPAEPASAEPASAEAARAWASGVRRELELLTTRVDSTCVIVNGSTGFGFSHGVRLLHVVVDPGLHERRPTRVFRR